MITVLRCQSVGNGIINADGELWKIQRKAGLRFFSNANLKNLIEEILPPILADTEKYLNHAAKMDNSVNLQSVMLELTTRVMGNMAYDMDMPASLPFSKSFDLASGKIAERFQNPFWAITELLLGGPLKRAVNEVKTFSSMIVSDAVDKRDKASRLAKENTYPLKNNLINALLDHIEDHEIVADAAMNYLSAGRDTTAQTLTWTLYLLMRHPEIRKRLETEIQALLALNSDHTPLSLEALQASSSSYAAAVFNESLRLYPPVPIEIKECTVPTTFPDGTSLPKGAIVMWTTWALGRSKNIWGGDADDFRPERWLMPGIEGEAQTLRSVTAFEWPVFNGGPRSCLGKRMAELLALSVITDLVSKFDFEEIIEGVLEPGHKPRERLSQNSLTLPMEGGLPCHIRQTREKSSSAGLI